MPLLQIGPYPKGTKIRIETLPDRNLFFAGDYSGVSMIDVDAGGYVYSATKVREPKRKVVELDETKEVYVGITKEQFQSLDGVDPINFRVIHTSEGGARWRCGYVGCGEAFTTKTSAVIHEAKHQGQDILADPSAKYDVEEKAKEMRQQMGKEKARQLGA